MKHAISILLPASLLVFGCAMFGCAKVETAATPAATAEWSVDVGSIDFPTSGSEEAQRHFLRGVAILHSFGYEQARTEFQRAQEIEPDFAMAYWGEALCYNHPLLPERDVETPRAVLARLGASPEERAAKAPTDREKAFLGAVESLFGEGTTAERRIAHMRAMERMYESYPGDDEVAAFYALTLLAAAGPLQDDTYRLAVAAGAIAVDLFHRNPDHPGAAHYTIHAFDDPVHAPLALDAAHRFAEIAPAVSHARHMPSHIFIQRGMWDQVSASNDTAYEAAADLWQPGSAVMDLVHALDWGHYGDLQRGDYAKAARWSALLDEWVTKSESAERAKSTVPLLAARTIVETEQWSTKPVTEESSASELLATGLSAVKLGDLELAKAAEKRLLSMSQREVSDRSTFQRGTSPTEVAQREVSALIRLAEGKSEAAVRLLEEGVEIEERSGPPRGAASPVKPVHELFGEVLLQLERNEEAIAMFERSLQRTPNRPRSLLGLARAHRAAGDAEAAAASYGRLVAAWQAAAQAPELAEAKGFLSS
jgi:tetratricopeptide (TPR) repeat protein